MDNTHKDSLAEALAREAGAVAEESLTVALLRQTGVEAARCYQCGKCSAGCPLVNDMDITSSGVMRMLQTEDPALEREVLRSEAIWLCASCEMCISRCPMQVDIPKVMDFMRQRSLARGMQNRKAARSIVAFHRSFLDIVRATGRSYEIGMVADYKMRSGKLWQDVMLAPAMFFKGKLPLLPEMVKGASGIRRIFAKSKP